MAQQDVLRLEAAVDDVDSGPGGEREDLEDLLGELAYEVEADAGEVPVLEESDQVEG